MSNEAIHNYAKSKFCNGIFKIIPHYGLPRKFYKLARNDKIKTKNMQSYRFAQCGQTATQCAPRITSDSRNDNKPPTASLRGANEMSNEAIYNLAKSKFCNGIFKIIPHYGLPQPLTRLRNDKRAKSAYRLPRVINHIIEK